MAFLIMILMIIECWCTLGSGIEQEVDQGYDVSCARMELESTVLRPGMILFLEDNVHKLFNAEFSVDSDYYTTELIVWDYAKEDGDYVQIFMDGIPTGDPFYLTNSLKTFKVREAAEVRIVGIKDGGNGITCAIYFSENQNTYFSGMNVGEESVFHLTWE